MPRRRIYSETLPFDDLLRRSTLALLARYELEVVLAVRPWQTGELAQVAATLRDAGVSLSVWPMLSDDDGRWASVHNADAFVALLRRTLDALEAAGETPRDVLIDLEPPFARAQALARHLGTEGILRVATGVVRPTSKRAYAAAEARLREALDEVRARGVTTSMAVWPLVALDPPGSNGWQMVLGTPVDALPADHVSVMLYTTILEGWSRHTLRRADAAALLARGAERVTGRFGAKSGVSLGCVGTGAFEDEPIYRAPAELAVDTAIARAAGCDELALFDLGGVLARPPPEAWLDAFTEDGEPARALPHASSRVAAARTLARAATWVVTRRT